MRVRFVSPLLDKILTDIEQLTLEEQLIVMGHLVERMKKYVTQSQPKRPFYETATLQEWGRYFNNGQKVTGEIHLYYQITP